MLRLPGKLDAAAFLKSYWQKQPLLLPAALDRVAPAITRNELGWLATFPDVESRLIFVERGPDKTRYRVETGPFTDEYLQNLPKRDWTLLVHDVEKHVPVFRALFDAVPFIPDWRIDDLMVSFAAPGGGVGPHRDNYDVFLCQGIGVRNWSFSGKSVHNDPGASDDLLLLEEFEPDENHDLSNGDVLYLPPGVAHWGVAKRACITYSIGMRAPQACDLGAEIDEEIGEDFYRDPDLAPDEAQPGHISSLSVSRARQLLPHHDDAPLAAALGRFSTRPKDHLCPDGGSLKDIARLFVHLRAGGALAVHGMAQIAYDDVNLYVNGEQLILPESGRELLHEICSRRIISMSPDLLVEHEELLVWMIQSGAFELPDE